MAEMVAAYKGGNMVAVMDVPRSKTGSYGIVTPGSDDGQVIDVTGLVEKPEPANAPQPSVLLAGISSNQASLPSLPIRIAAQAMRYN